MTYDVGNQGPGLGQAQKCGRVNPNPPKSSRQDIIPTVYVKPS